MTKHASDVDAFFSTLKHPHTDALRAVRQVILDADPKITEGIKWNVPSFQTTEYFATLHVRTKKGIGVILHFGAKKRAGLTARAEIKDATSALAWLADRGAGDVPLPDLLAGGAHQRDDDLWVYRTVRARSLWDQMMAATYDHAEPGVVFIDTWARFSGREGNWAQFVIDPRDNQGKAVRADDGFHLNTTGAEILAIDIADAVKQLMRDRGAQFLSLIHISEPTRPY